ncbi:MAG: YicC/YloC family endoribonuclease [Clostridia bacterium]|nr:YicC/YloC family endoribonuclease [Clostridia bacterium]
MLSMTGYGRGVANADGRELVVELKSVNHRFLDLGIRLPRQLNCIEDKLRNVIGGKLARGHVDVYVNYTNARSDAKSVEVDSALLQAYVTAAREANAGLGLHDDLTLTKALALPEATRIVNSEEDSEALIALAGEAAAQAAEALIAMRRIEGEKLKADLFAHLSALLNLVSRLTVRAPLIAQNYRKKLTERIESFLSDDEIDRARLATEIALFADRSAIDEELARLNSHLEQFELLLDVDEPVGRRLDFVIQEMNREINTIGSKANDAELTQLMLEGKNVIEKLREQVQNIE